MKRVMVFWVAIVGWITLLTYFDGVLTPIVDWARYLPRVRTVLVNIAVITVAFGLVLGVLNLLSVHATRIVRRRPGGFYSFILLASMIVLVPVAYAWDFWNAMTQGMNLGQSISGGGMTSLYKYVLVPIQASLAALLPFILAFAAYRTLRMRSASSRWGALVFLLTAVAVLLGQVPLLNLTILKDMREWIIRVPAMAGMRGILLGIALGITGTALRVLIGADRPSSD